MNKPIEICNHCGRSVAFGSGFFVNRVPDFNDISVRIENKRIYPKGDFVCIECDSADDQRSMQQVNIG
jgi:hypothetical protein